MTKNSETLSIILGILWGAIPLSYWLTGTPNPSYISIIAVYIGAILVGSVRSIPRSAVIMLSITSILFSISTMNELGSAIEVRPYFTLGLFAVNLSLMLAIIQPERTNTFLALFFKTTSACAMLHIFLVFAGQVEDHFGRYFFLGNAHSNLGGEIYAIASFAGAVSTKRKSMLIFSAPLLVSAFFMQTRTGMIVIGLTLLIRIFVINGNKVKFQSLLIGFASAVTFIILASLIPSIREWFFEKILLADDVNRGLSTGLITGRDQRWLAAFNDFLQSPFLGNGLSWYSTGRLSAHNPILYSLVFFGLFGIIFWIAIFFYSALLLRRNLATFVLILPNVLMVILNDRFLNSNAFPLLFYFCILQLSRKPAVRLTVTQEFVR